MAYYAYWRKTGPLKRYEVRVNNGQKYGSLLGFDAREMCTSFAQDWEVCRQEDFLLKSDFVKPLSVDDAVWEKIIEFALEQSEDTSALEKALPEWIGSHINLWSRLSELSTFCATVDSLLPKPYWIIAITIVEDTDLQNYLASKDDYYSLLHLNESKPSELDDQWEFLGFDVADDGRLSGLMNCGYGESEEDATSTFAASLNQYHLFMDIEQADKFRLYSNRRVEEHAPFFIYGLFKVACYSKP
jgi:hypothetical protein